MKCRCVETNKSAMSAGAETAPTSVSLLASLNFLSCRDDLFHILDGDFGAWRYHDGKSEKREQLQKRPHAQVRNQSYSVHWILIQPKTCHFTFDDISSTIQDKISFLGGRGSSPFLDKKHRGGRVRGPLRELEALLSEQVNSEPLDRQLIEAFKDFIAQNVAFSAWRNSSLYQIMFAGGTIANVWLNKVGDLERITFDKVC